MIIIQNLKQLLIGKTGAKLFSTKMSEFIEKTVCKITDLKNNEKKEFDFGDNTKVLVIKQNDTFSALSPKCSHYGAPLVNGVLHNNKISCPWHGATFCVTTGDIEDFPGCDSLFKYEVKIKGSDVVVRAKASELNKKSRTKALTSKNPKNVLTFVVVGGGPSGLQCADTLRQEGFTGRVILVSAEDTVPYDRTKLSKAMNIKVEEIILRSKDYLSSANIEVMLNKKVNKIDPKGKSIELNDGSKLQFDRVFLGTGVRPRKLEVEGKDLKNICYLRTHSDANYIANNGVDKNVVIVGTSFIGMEVTAFLNGKAKSLTVIGKSKYPFSQSLGPEIGEQIKKLYELKGIKFHTDSDVKQFRGSNGCLKEVVLSDGKVLSADLCVIGIGSEPNTEFLKDTTVKMDKSYVVVDKNFETNEKNVFAGGDIVRYPLNLIDEKVVNVGHWQTAQSHGRFAALAMLGKSCKVKSVPFFWSMFFGKGLRFAGNNEGFKNIIIQGQLSELKFVAYYIDGSDRVLSVATMANDPIATMFSSLLRSGKTLTGAEIKSNPEKWIDSMKNGK